MYQEYWGLSEKPFAYRTAATELYPSQALRAASLRLQYCFRNNAGAALLIGQSGVGKSSVLRKLAADDLNLRPFANVVFPALSCTELQRVVAAEVLETSSVDNLESPDTIFAQLRTSLRSHTAQSRHPVIVFDEAHLLTNDALNQVVLPLLSVADMDATLSLTVVLAGQPSLAAHVGRNAQLRDRIAVTATMDGFTESETMEYIQTCMTAAGADRTIFAADAIQAITQLSAGNPRRVNRLCDMALLVGYADQLSEVTASDIESLAAEILPAAA
ncbi:MAG: AAA family ATPase [Fuerstiella sp.]|nr:AAA family ATPase [Fuerstiella sp.]